jgi:hypothetical protein
MMDSDTTSDTGLRGLKLWLRSPVTLTLPGWGIVAGAAALVVLMLVALD